MFFPEIKVVAGEDGKAWLCFAVTSVDINRLTALFVDLAGRCRALSGKVRTAELTRYRKDLGNVA